MSTMGAMRLWVRIELRRRWRRHVALVLMLGLVGAFSLTCLAGARRTASAYDRFASHQALPDIELAASADHKTMQALGGLPGAVAAGSYVPFFAAPAGHQLLPGQDFMVFAASDRSYYRTVDRPLITSGRMPAVGRADEVLVARATADKLGLHLDDELTLDSITPAQYAEISKGGTTDNLAFQGPRPTVRVVGIGRTRLDTLSYAPAYLVATEAFYQRYATTMASYGELTDVRLAGGAAAADRYRDAAEKRVGGDAAGLYVSSPRKQFEGIRGAASVQGVALALLGLVAALAGAVVISQAVGRHLADSAAARQVLAVLGLDRRGRVAMAVAAFAPAVAIGGVLAVVGAWFASSRFPNGPTRAFEVHPGTQLDARTLLPGATLLGLLVLGRVALAAGRAPAVVDRGRAPSRTSAVDRVVRALAAPEATGLRWALPGPRDAARLTARAGVIGVVVGAAGLSAALSYGASFNRLVSTPAAYGWTFDADAGGGDDPSAVAGLRDAMGRDKAVGDLATMHIVSAISVGGRMMQGLAFTPVRGVFSVTLVAGRPPTGPDEVVLGTKSAKDLRVPLGGRVDVPVKNGSRSLHVVGLGLFPNIESDRFASGALLTPAGLAQVVAEPGYDHVVFRWVPGTDVAASTTRLRSAGLPPALAAPPPGIGSLALVRRYPAWLGAFVASLALLAVGNVLVVSVRRRRRQTGVLRAIGFTRRQVMRTVAAQGVAFVTVGLVVGLPLGIAFGRTAWRLHANRLGVGVVQLVPLQTLVLLGCGGLLLTAVAGWAMAGVATRRVPADVLRDE